MAPPAEIFAGLAAVLPKANLRRDEPLARRTTLRVGGAADFYAEPSSEAELAAALQFCRAESVPVRVLGRGSNLLVRDGGVRGLVLCLCQANFSQVEARGTELWCGAGARLKAVSAKARELNWAGLEFLEGIPGSVGGALRMNAGAMGSAVAEITRRVRFMDYEGNAAELPAAEVRWDYRHCALFDTHIALGAALAGRTGTREDIAQRAAACNEKRWGSQPKEPSAGCIFKNPSGELSAGRLVEELGLKGTRRGGAEISPVHGNFIVNNGGASARDVLELVAFIQAKARAERGVELRTEVEIIGDDCG